MKKLHLFLFIICVGTVSAQNPDGKNVSLHLTPVWMWGSSKFNRVTSVWYPPTQASDAQSVTSKNYGIADYALGFGISTEVRIPTTSFLTVTLGYSYNPRFEEEKANPAFKESAYYTEYNSINGGLHTVSATLSIYNLFSLYMGD
jgi:hypothetical protein